MKHWANHPILLLFVVVLAASCNTKDEIPQGEDNLFFVEFVIGNDTVRYEDGVNNYGNGPGISTYEDSVGRLHSEFSTFIKSALDSTYERNIFTVQMVKFLTDTSYPSPTTAFSFFDVGSYDYGAYDLDSSRAGIDGAVINYTDQNGKIWTSDQQAGQQESWANFAITEHKAIADDQFGAKTKGTFNCRVFDGLGGSLDLKNGRFHARTIFQRQ